MAHGAVPVAEAVAMTIAVKGVKTTHLSCGALPSSQLR
jgi:hypothetical protein